MNDSNGNWPEWVETTAKIVSGVILVAAVVATVAAVTAFTAGTGCALAVYGATAVLSAALGGINGAVANEANGNSYANGYVGGYVGGGMQAAASYVPGGNIFGGFAGATKGTAITMVLNNIDPDSSDSTTGEIVDNSLRSGIKAACTGMVTEYMSYSVDYGLATGGCNGLMPELTFGFGVAIKAFFGWVDDALVYVTG